MSKRNRVKGRSSSLMEGQGTGTKNKKSGRSAEKLVRHKESFGERLCRGIQDYMQPDSVDKVRDKSRIHGSMAALLGYLLFAVLIGQLPLEGLMYAAPFVIFVATMTWYIWVHSRIAVRGTYPRLALVMTVLHPVFAVLGLLILYR